MIPTLLILTDSVITNVWLKKHLKGQFHIIHATDPQTALERVRNTTIGLAILDTHVEAMVLPSFLRELRKAAQSPVPILLITENLKKSYRNRMVKAGVTDFLADPLEEEELQRGIAKALEMSGRERRVLEASGVLKETKQGVSESTLADKFLLSDKAVRAIAQAKKEKKPLTAALIAVDEFEKMQRTHGLLEIERILLFFSEIVTQSLQKEDILLPSKEGKFLLIMPNTSPAKAEELAGKIQKNLKAKSLPTAKGPLRLSASIVLSSSEDGSQLEEVLEMAARALKKIETTCQIISLGKRKS